MRSVRASFEEHYRHRYQWSEQRVDTAQLDAVGGDRDHHYGLHCGSMYGHARNGKIDELIPIWLDCGVA
jgi:hypothetical protein